MEEPNTVEVVIQDIAKSIFYLKKQKGLIDKQAEELKIESSKLDAQITKLENDLLNGMKFFGDIQEFQVDDIVSTRFKRDNIGYTSDADVLNYLKEKYAGQYIKSKLTESLDKTALKKAIKTDPVLSEALESMTVKTITEYVVVTDVENHRKMLEHINESKS